MLFATTWLHWTETLHVSFFNHCSMIWDPKNKILEKLLLNVCMLCSNSALSFFCAARKEEKKMLEFSVLLENEEEKKRRNREGYLEVEDFRVCFLQTRPCLKWKLHWAEGGCEKEVWTTKQGKSLANTSSPFLFEGGSLDHLWQVLHKLLNFKDI